MRWLIITFLLLLGILSIEAQDYDVCAGWGLTGDDCTLMQNATEQMGQLQSAQFDLDLTLNYDSIYLNEPIHMAAVGSYWLDPEVLTELSDPDAPIFDSPVRALQRAMGGINTQMTLRMDVPTWATEGMATMPDRIGMDLALVDSVGYIDLTDLSALSPDDIPTGWYGLDLRPFIPTLLAGEANPFRQQQAPIDSPLMGIMPEGMTTTRLPDVTIDGESVAVLEITIDAGAAFGADTEYGRLFRQTLRDVYMQQGLSQEEAKDTTDMFVDLIETMRLDYIFMIGKESYHFYTVQMYLDAAIPDSFWESMGAAGSAGMMDGLSMTMTLELRDHNRTAPAEAPANAEIIPFTEIMPLLFGQQTS
jgi:hypothetical protein